MGGREIPALSPKYCNNAMMQCLCEDTHTRTYTWEVWEDIFSQVCFPFLSDAFFFLFLSFPLVSSSFLPFFLYIHVCLSHSPPVPIFAPHTVLTSTPALTQSHTRALVFLFYLAVSDRRLRMTHDLILLSHTENDRSKAPLMKPTNSNAHSELDN